MVITEIDISGSSQQSASLPSTRARVVSTAPVFYAVGDNPVAFSSNCEIILPNVKKDIILSSINQKVAILGMGTSGDVTISSVGNPIPNVNTIIQFFTNSEKGVWYDPSDFSTLFQDSAGTIPVTTVGDPVGLMLDKSGNGFHAYQTTALNRPILAVDANNNYYLYFNGSTSRMETNAIDLSSVNKMTIVVGVSKMTEVAGMIVEFSTNASTTDGAFYVQSSNSNGENYRVLFRGNAIGGAIPSVTAPDTSVLATTATLSTPGAFLLRRNGIQHTSSTPSFGAVNFGNHKLFLGARSGGFINFNGGLYGLIIRAAETTIGNLQDAEVYMQAKTRE